MDRINIAITMDCEPITSLTHASATGPDTWALGERAVRGIAAITRDFGFGITYFIHPEPALAQPALFREMEAEGACIGLHMHPWKYSLSRHGGRRYLEHYGGLSEAEQRDLVSEASALWSEAIGRWPLYFRPGTFSANDAVFKVLAELGFRGGSCSLPGRQMPEMRANWTGTVPDPHRGHARFRQLDGDLDFAEMPLSTDFSIALSGRIGGKLHPDLRPDIDWLAQYELTYDTIATNIVAQIVERAPAVPVINLVTHNHFDFSDPRHPATVRLTQALAGIRDACARAGVKAVPATMHDIASAVLARPPVAQEFVCEGAVYGKSGGVGTLAPKLAA